MFICKHEVQYYETDRMGITHHSNYVRWMEEARTFFLREIGWPYEKIEEEGIISPVTSISCDYKATSTFADEISIEIIMVFLFVQLLLNIVSYLRMVVLLILKEIIPHFLIF